MSRSVIVLTFIVSSSVGALAQSGSEFGSIRGTVRDVRNNAPLVNAQVSLTPRTGGGAARTIEASTARTGNFVFSRLEAGEYQLVPRRDGYVDATEGFVSTVTRSVLVRSGQSVEGVTLLMGPAGVISGTVLNIERQGVADAPVRAFRHVYDEIRYRWMWMPIELVTTSDGGNFRFEGLHPGRYVVRATPPSNVKLDDSLARIQDSDAFETLPEAVRAAITTGQVPGNSGGDGLLPIYYPNTSDLLQAVRIDVDYGRENFVQIVMPLEPGFSIRGAVVDPMSLGRRPSYFALSSRAIRLQPFRRIEDDGSFEIRNLAPGTYDINVILTASEQAGTVPSHISGRPPMPVPVQPNLDPDRLVDHVQVTIINDDVEGVEIVPEVVAVSGTVEAADGGMLPEGLFVAIRGPGLSTNQPHPVELDEDGAFTITHVPEGDYRLIVTGLSSRGMPDGLPAGWYVDSARLGAIDASAAEFRVDRSWAAQPLTIVLRRSSGSLSVAVEALGQSEGTVFVAAVPDVARRHQPDLHRTGWTDERGFLTFDAIAPGEYRVFAWERIAVNAWLDPEYIASIEGRGQIVRVGENGREHVDVRVVR